MWKILQGDARHIPLGDETVQCVVTSPPYWGLRDYGIGDDAIGLEATPELYIEHMVQIFQEVRRVLRKDGTVWMNLGDSYNSKPASNGISFRRDRAAVTPVYRNVDTLKVKDLCGIPWRVALALQADGWWLRSDIIWSKPNPMPESVTDRPTRSHEYVFLLTKSSTYYYDQEAVREPLQTDPKENYPARARILGRGQQPGVSQHPSGPQQDNSGGYAPSGNGRNLRSVWHIPTQPFPEAHFATFPQALVEPCIKAGTSEKGCCAECGNPWERVTEHEYRKHRPSAGNDPRSRSEDKQAEGSLSGKHGWKGNNLLKDVTTLGWQPTCKCRINDAAPCLVLDPFAGSGTVGVVCLKLGRSFVGIELKREYTEMANKRVFNSGSLLA